MLLSRGAAALQQQPRRVAVGGRSERRSGNGGCCAGAFRRSLITTTTTSINNRTAAASAAAASDTTSSSDAPTSPHVSLVQGASRGIGLEMVRQLLERPDASLAGRPLAAGGHVVATCRDPGAAAALIELQRAFPRRLTVLPLDVTDSASIASAAAVVKDLHGRIDVMANTAAVLHVPGEMAPETSISRIDEEAMMQSFRVNAMGPVMVVKAFAPLLMEATARSSAAAVAAAADGTIFEARPAIVANLSARVSSIGDNSLGRGRCALHHDFKFFKNISTTPLLPS